MFDDKVVLITGGTGSFGRKFTKALLQRYQPKKIIIFSRDELKQFEMQQVYDHDCMRYFIGDIRDKERVMQACNGVDYIIHAAALKQVPAAEYNPTECIRTNIHGAENVIRAAMNTDVQKVMALSTDKAACPVNLYGATKLASDKLFVAANNMAGGNTEFSVVRYGNVVGSRGSVVPFFKKMKEEGKAIPITDESMTRFWITLQQGVDFVIKNFSRMKGGEIFVPKIPSVKITDLAEAIAPGIDRQVIGIRPGEKLHETMCPYDDSHLTIEFDDHYVITPTIKLFRYVNYETNNLGESGRYVDSGFSYNSGSNPVFLDVTEITQLHEQAQV